MSATDQGRWSGSAMAVPGGMVLLAPDAVLLADFLIRDYIAATGGRNGLAPGAGLSPGMRELRDALQAAMSDNGHADVRKAAPQAASVSPVRADDLIDVKEATRMLQPLCERHVRRLATGEAFGPVRRSGRSILVRRAEVEAFAMRRTEGP